MASVARAIPPCGMAHGNRRRGEVHRAGLKQAWRLSPAKPVALEQVYLVDECSIVREIRDAVYVSRNVLGGEPHLVTLGHRPRVIAPARESGPAKLRIPREVVRRREAGPD